MALPQSTEFPTDPQDGRGVVARRLSSDISNADLSLSAGACSPSPLGQPARSEMISLYEKDQLVEAMA